jgi:RNA 3'-terminal phosphate cyclase (ATP)
VIDIDGARGEGGGQVLRTALGLAAVTGRATRVSNVRARRAKPGLMRQHLAAVRALATICDGTLVGDGIGSRAVELRPGRVRAGRYRFEVGSAGSTTLVLQTVLPALLLADGESELTITGGTHNPLAPPFEFLARSLGPQLEAMGYGLSVELVRHGFMPAGGGEICVRISGRSPAELRPYFATSRGEVTGVRARALVSGLPGSIGAREIETVVAGLPALAVDARPEMIPNARGPGNAVVIELSDGKVTEVVTSFGEPGQPAEVVASHAVAAARAYLTAGAPVGPHLADQLLVPMALAKGGAFHTSAPTLHTETQMDLITELLGVRVERARVDETTWEIRVHGIEPSLPRDARGL